VFIPQILCFHTDNREDVIEGAEDYDGEERRFGLGMSNKRDPDALPPDNAIEWTMHFIYTFFVSLTGGNVLYGIKAGLFIGKEPAVSFCAD